MQSIFRYLALGVVLTLVLFHQSPTHAQFLLKDKDNKEVKLTISPTSPKAGDVLTVKLRVDVPKGGHTYSMADGFSGKTVVKFDVASGVEAVDASFKCDQKPTLEKQEGIDKPVETLTGTVTWTRQFKVVDAAKFALSGTAIVNVCDDSGCRPIRHKFQFGDLSQATTSKPATANSGSSAKLKYEAEYVPTVFGENGDKKPGPVAWTAKLAPNNAKPGETVTLSFTARIEDGHHVFALDQNPANLGLPTVFKVASMGGLEAIPGKTSFTADRTPEVHESQGKEQRYYHNMVTFQRTYRVMAGVEPGKYGVKGLTSYQVCKISCIRGKFDFELGDLSEAKAVAVVDPVENPVPQPGNESALSQFLGVLKYKNHGLTRDDASLGLYLLYAFIGGIILNVMPCVLPVIAIKALGFAQQAGESRHRVLLLNLSYSAGVLVVFAVLASLAAFAGYAWGGLFQQVGFNIAMCILVFAMSLSLLGVFEIPVPGFVGSAAGGAQHKEGLGGAFFTGIFATVMATPCSGPFLGTTLGWSVKQSIPVIYLVWLMIGVGMSIPYVLFGLIPQAIKLLPKPGNWMIRFKQIAGFCLLGTTVYLMTILSDKYLMPMIVSLFAVGFGLWMIGNLYDFNSTNQRRWIVRVCSFSFMFVVSYVGFKGFEEKLKWQKYQPEAVMAALKDNKAVFIDFTADWCATCKVVERATLNTDATKEIVEKYGIVPFKADWTTEDSTIEATLEKFGSNNLPLLAVFSPSNPTEPIILREAWTKSTLLELLERAANPQAKATNSTSVATTAR